MNIADIIAALSAGQDPNQAIIQAAQPGPPSLVGENMQATPGIMPQTAALPPGLPPVPQAAPPPQTTTPQGVVTPITNPTPQNATPEAYKSPPDLSNMYLEMIKKNQNAAQMDSGLSLIAAGLTPHAATRASLIGLAGKEGRADSSAGVGASLLGFHKAQVESQQRLLRQSLLGGLAKQYNLSPESAQYLESSGKLDEVIKEMHTGGLTLVTDPATGKQSFYHSKTGQKVVDLGGGLKPTTDQQELAGINEKRVASGQPPLSMEEYQSTVKREGPAADDRAKLADINQSRAAEGKPPMTMEEYIVLKKPAGTNVYVSPEGTQFPAPPPGYDYERNPDGKVKIGADGKPTMYSASPKAKGEEKKTELDVAKDEKAAKEAEQGDLQKARQNYSAVSSVFAAAENAENIMKNDKWYNPATGFMSSLFAQFGGTPATNMRAQLKTIDANTAFTQLQAMRDASKSGAALGPVSDFENKMLASTIASVDPNQSDEYIIKGLVRIKATMKLLAERNFMKEAGMDRATAMRNYQKALADEMRDLEPKGKGAPSGRKIEQITE